MGTHGTWISYTDGPGGKDHLPPDVRAEVERWEAQRSQRRGRLLCEVNVRVYEHDTEDAEMWVSFPATRSWAWNPTVTRSRPPSRALASNWAAGGRRRADDSAT